MERVGIVMTRLELEARLRGVNECREKLIADANAALGQMREIQYWLSRLPEERPEEANVVALADKVA